MSDKTEQYYRCKRVCKYHIDGKSIMGIFSLELDRPIEMEMSDADMEKLKSQFEKFMIG